LFSADDGINGAELWRAADTVAPQTTITSGPAEGETVLGDSATFAFQGTAGDTAKLQCSLDGAPFSDCATPTTFDGLAPGDHNARFRAVDFAGNIDPTPATRNFTVEPDNNFRLPKNGKNNKRKGTIKLTIKGLPGPGKLVARSKGKKLVKTTKKNVKKAGKKKLKIKTNRRGKRKLNRKLRKGKKVAKLNVKVKVTYTPTGGSKNSKTRKYKLKQK
ncbi:MAG TPA: hypothetical protein VKA36_02835, partial [Solirubrobacterales bacterium]|nr:hypothetical protein [Solirubrobacterales bacterium]